mgnify:CR=1 FL=1
MNAQLRRAYLRGFLEKTAQWGREQGSRNIALAEQQAAANARVKAYFDGRANPNENYGMGRIMDRLVKAQLPVYPPDVPAGPYKVRAVYDARIAKILAGVKAYDAERAAAKAQKIKDWEDQWAKDRAADAEARVISQQWQDWARRRTQTAKDQYTPPLDSVISGVATNRAGAAK